MTKAHRILSVAAAALLAALPLHAQAKKIVASTWWTAAIARAGGASGEILVIAPAELKHPPEYELKPADLLAVKGADLLVYGGYEKFAARILEASGRSDAGLKLSTDNRPENLIAEAGKVAERLGTKAEYEEWAAGFRSYAEASRARVIAGLFPDGSPRGRVVVQGFLKAWMEWMGFAVAGTFGPGEPSPAQILELAKAKPVLVIDNYHNPSGATLAESLGARYCLLINFPGKDGTRTIEDVYAYNEKALIGAKLPGKAKDAGEKR